MNLEDEIRVAAAPLKKEIIAMQEHFRRLDHAVKDLFRSTGKLEAAQATISFRQSELSRRCGDLEEKIEIHDTPTLDGLAPIVDRQGQLDDVAVRERLREIKAELEMLSPMVEVSGETVLGRTILRAIAVLEQVAP
jgi:chromosome segregation ATPase